MQAILSFYTLHTRRFGRGRQYEAQLTPVVYHAAS